MTLLRAFSPCITGAILLVTCRIAVADATDVVESYMEAYNRHDVDAVVAHLAEDVRWLSIAGASMTTESSGRQKIADGLRDYFAALPSTGSVIRAIHANGNFVSVVEEARWSRDGETARACALAVYEVEGSYIKHVWYFANQSCAPEPE